MPKDVVFVHIPKTAGSSLRTGLEKALRKDYRMLFDYGRDGGKTTPELLELLYDRQALHEFRSHYPRDTPTFLSGHFPASKYLPFFNPGTFVTFLRNPVDRVISEYAHFTARNGFGGGLHDFLALPHMTTRLQHFIDVDIRAFGFIGFMEEFETSVQALSEQVGFPIPIIRKNPGDYSQVEAQLRNDETLAIVRESCKGDIAFYETIRRSYARQT